MIRDRKPILSPGITQESRKGQGPAQTVRDPGRAQLPARPGLSDQGRPAADRDQLRRGEAPRLALHRLERGDDVVGPGRLQLLVLQTGHQFEQLARLTAEQELQAELRDWVSDGGAWIECPGYQIASLDGMNCYPYVVSFPDYPFRPSGWDIRTAFEAPADWGEYHLQRMRGFLHPPASGEYTFWIASDNSSELWLSTSDNPANATRIAYVDGWTNSREWTKYASQQSASINLTAGQKYDIKVEYYDHSRQCAKKLCNQMANSEADRFVSDCMMAGLNVIGMQRAGMGEEQVGRVKQAYKILFRSNLGLAEALAQMEAELGAFPEVAHLIGFVRSSQRGITR